jgi:hypothetical protein
VLPVLAVVLIVVAIVAIILILIAAIGSALTKDDRQPEPQPAAAVEFDYETVEGQPIVDPTALVRSDNATNASTNNADTETDHLN